MTRVLWLLCLVTFVVAFQYPIFDDLTEDRAVGDPVIIDVTQGRIVGQVKEHDNYTYHSFESIPFAKPPKHELRFKDPEPADPWEGDLNATSAAPSCPQFIILGQEDCLYLNVYTPPDALEQAEPLPVMAFIYGGAYYLGGSNTYSGAQPIVKHNVILVTMNYRLGVLGFMSTEDSAAPGNLGLKDQNLALRWVQDNIAAFGGDPARVTIFGESAGSASVHYHILSPYSAGLFSAAILESGSSFSPWSRGRDFLRVSEEIGDRFNCPINDTDAMVTCLQGKSYILISEMYTNFIEWNFQPFIFAPRIDGDFIPDEPATLVKEGRYNHVPVMMGMNQHEGSLISGEMYWDRNLIDALVENFTFTGQPSLELYDDEEPLDTATKAYDYYLGGLNFEYEDADNATKLYSDRLFMIPMDWLNQQIADVDDVYVWELRHRGKISLLNLFVGLNDSLAERWICHTDELPYLFSGFAFEKLTDPDDILVSEIFTKMWTNFAKTGNPTPDDSLGFIWEKSNSADLRYLAITSNLPLAMETDKRAVERAFWETLPLRINSLLRP